MRLKVHWKSNLLPSWTLLVLTSLCRVLKGYVILLEVVPCPLPSCFSDMEATRLGWPRRLSADTTQEGEVTG